MFKVLVSDNVAQECVNILSEPAEIEVDFNTGLSPDELKEIIGQYDALVVRSATKVREDIIAKAEKLKVIGRAGAGVDNIDIPQATDAGIVVLNTPGGNTVSTAEHAFSLMMALSRNVAQGDRSIKEGRWDRKKYMGVELRGKTLGIVGLGNIGQVMAKRAKGFEMNVIGYDPFVSKEVAQRAGIDLVKLEDIWAGSDYITFHTPVNDSTRHILNADTFAKCKDGVRIINCARGGIVDEAALLAAVESGKVAGAALDVYENEPPEQSPLVMNEKIVCTPHLGASTAEAQDIVAVMVAEQIRDFLLNGEVRNAVNVPSMASEAYAELKPYMNLAEKMGSLIGQLGDGQLSDVTVSYFGAMTSLETWAITSSALSGLFTRGYAEGVNMINATKTAEKLGIKMNEVKSAEEQGFRNCMELKLTTDKGDISVLGTIFGKEEPRIAKLLGYELDFAPDGNVLVCGTVDRPGTIGKIGTILGEKGVNIAYMNWARNKETGNAIVVLRTDDSVDADTLKAVEAIDNIEWTQQLSF